MFIFITIITSIFKITSSQFLEWKGISKYNEFFITVITLLMAFLSLYIGENFGNKFFKLENFIKISFISFILPAFIGILEIINYYILNMKITSFINAFMSFFSYKLSIPGRVSMLTLEPSWAGDILVLFYIPLFLSIILYKENFKKRISLISFLFLITSIILLFFTKSAGAITAFIFMIFYLLIPRIKKQIYHKEIIKIIIFLMIILIVLVFTTDINHIFGRFYNIFKTLTTSRISDGSAFVRSAYWYGGLMVFINNPIMGVGWGSSGFYFPEFIPEKMKIGEVALYLSEELAVIPNIKSLLIRIMAESGIIGLVIFSVFIFKVFQKTKDSYDYSSNNVIKLFVRLSILGLLVESFSIDTFGFIYPWLQIGLLIGLRNRKYYINSQGEGKQIENISRR
jgi:hypothetical protein